MPDSTNARWDADQQSWVGGTRPESAGGETPRQLNIPTLMLVPLVVLLIVVAVAAAVVISRSPSPGDSESPQDQPASESQSADVMASSVPEDAGEEETSAGGDDGGGDRSGSGSSSEGGSVDQVVTRVNGERASAGCDPLRVDPRLTAAAQEHSEDMDRRDYMGHENPEGEGPADRALRHGYDAWGAENVAEGQTSAAQVMDAWMGSRGHRDNILNCDLVAIGVGESGNAWTQKFGWE